MKKINLVEIIIILGVIILIYSWLSALLGEPKQLPEGFSGEDIGYDNQDFY